MPQPNLQSIQLPPRILAYTTNDKPGQVWLPMYQSWVANTDSRYTDWLAKWNKTPINFATTNELSNYLDGSSCNPTPTTGQVNYLRDQKLATGYTDVTTGKTWQCDDKSVSNWTAIAASAGLAVMSNTAMTFTLIAGDNTTVTLPAANTYALFNQRVMPWVSNTVLYARTMKNNILAGTPPTDYTAGWPTS